MNGFFYPWWFWGCTLGLLCYYAFVLFKDSRDKKTERKDEVEEFNVADDEEEISTVVEELPGGDFRLSGEGAVDEIPGDEAFQDEESDAEQDDNWNYEDEDDGDGISSTDATATEDLSSPSDGPSDGEAGEGGDTPYDEALAIQNTQMSSVREERRWEQMFGSMDMFAELAAPLSHKTLCKRTPITTL